MMENKAINKRFLRIPRRAERGDVETLHQSFVSVADIESILDNPENQFILGRRGTGKTHALHYLQNKAEGKGGITIYIDLRLLGSNGSLYADPVLPKEQRIANLAVDFLATILNVLADIETDPSKNDLFGSMNPHLDELAAGISKIYVTSEVEATDETSSETESGSARSASIGSTKAAPSLNVSASDSTKSKQGKKKQKRTKGVEKYTIHFATIGKAFKSISDSVGVRIWIFVDEWTAVPEELQPYLADIIRRVIFPVSRITVVGASIEHRSRFQLGVGGKYIGIELGADCAASINLDDFMVAENNMDAAVDFFGSLLYQHVKIVDYAEPFPSKIQSKEDLLKTAFKKKALVELVRAAEGVPRDAINIMALAAQEAQDAPVAVTHIRAAAAKWFEQDKSHFLRQNREAEYLLGWIVDKVIGGKKARAFLVDKSIRNKLLDDLFDGRVLHVLRQSISSAEEPATRYTAYKIDYGCYIGLVSGSRAPQGLFRGDDDANKRAMWVNVPPDDYAQIRQSILNVREFDAHQFEKKIGDLFGHSGGVVAPWHAIISRLANINEAHREAAIKARVRGKRARGGSRRP